MSEPITLHDAVMALAAEIAANENLTVSERTRWLDMLIVINRAASDTTIDAVDSLSVALTNALDTHAPATEEEDDLGDDFGDDDMND